MSQFDACIILYNIQKRTYRFTNTLPARFLFALTSGIPIIVPAILFAACEDFIKKQEIGFSYHDVADLKQKLSDREMMGLYGKNAAEKRTGFMYEKHIQEVEEFMVGVMEDYSWR